LQFSRGLFAVPALPDKAITCPDWRDKPGKHFSWKIPILQKRKLQSILTTQTTCFGNIAQGIGIPLDTLKGLDAAA
jgi:hypothetical protein